MPAIDLLQYLPAPHQQQRVIARRRAALAHPLVRPDYTVEKKKHFQRITQDLKAAGHKTATPTYVGRDLRLYRYTYEYLTAPDNRQKLCQLALKTPPRYEYLGVRLLVECGVETIEALEKLLVRGGETQKPSAEAQVVPTHESSGPDTRIASAIETISSLLCDLGEENRQLKDRNTTLEAQAKEIEVRIAQAPSQDRLETVLAKNTELNERLAKVQGWLIGSLGGIPPKLLEILGEATLPAPEKATTPPPSVGPQTEPAARSQAKKKAPAPKVPSPPTYCHATKRKITYSKKFLKILGGMERPIQDLIERSLEEFSRDGPRAVGSIRLRKKVAGVNTSEGHYFMAWKFCLVYSDAKNQYYFTTMLTRGDMPGMKER